MWSARFRLASLWLSQVARVAADYCLRAFVVLELARAAHEENAFDRLPVLGDAVEDAGCTNRAVLDNCRGPDPQVRGCWVVDLLLGKQ